jgi:dCMP deaminase
MRPSWDEYFIELARVTASRATCDRKHVGCVLTRNKVVIATGYNGSIRGLPHCDDEGHEMVGGHCIRTVHAEANAIAQAARYGHAIDGCTAYVTASPCHNCFGLLANAGVRRIVFAEFYRDDTLFGLAKQAGIELVFP